MLIYYFKKSIYKFLSAISKEMFLKFQFQRLVGYRLNLKSPKTYNEKLQWLKLYYRDEKMSQCADKVEVRKYIKDKGLGDFLNEVYGVWGDVDDIDFDRLPKQFVMKSTHASGQTIICRDKSTLNIEAAKKKMKKWLKTNLYYFGLEWVYKDLQPRIICEALISSKDTYPPKDYKFYCFNGQPKFILVASERNGHNAKMDYFDLNWELIDMRQGGDRSGIGILKPSNLEKMIDIAKVLSQDFPHVRVDFYNEDGKILIGELTFFDSSGFAKFEPKEYDRVIGDFLLLPKKV